jgi:hypothetical protein
MTSRALGAVVASFLARTIMNAAFFGFALGAQMKALAAAHPGFMRADMPLGYFIGADFVFSALFVFMLSRIGHACGGGAQAGAKLGAMLALLGPVLGSVYTYFSLNFLNGSTVIVEDIYYVVSGVIAGAIAGAIALKSGAAAAAAA